MCRMEDKQKPILYVHKTEKKEIIVTTRTYSDEAMMMTYKNKDNL